MKYKYRKTINNWVDYENAMPYKIILTRECQGSGITDFWWDMTIKVCHSINGNKTAYKIFEGIATENDVMELLINYKEYMKYPRYQLPLERLEVSNFKRIMRFIGWLDQKLSVNIFSRRNGNSK